MSHTRLSSDPARPDVAAGVALVLVLAAYVACALPKLTTLPRVNVDEPWMLQLAHQFRTTGRITLPMFGIHDSFVLQPGYSVVVAPWTAVFGEGIYQARLLSVIFGALILWLTYRAGQRLLSARAGIAAAMFLAVDSNFLGMVRMTRHDVMSIAFAVGALLVAARALHSGRAVLYAVSGLLSGIAFLFHANAYWTMAVAGLWMLLRHGIDVVRRRGPYAYVAGVVAGLSPILLRWRTYAQQLEMFAGNITPGLSWSRLAASAAAEPGRYRYWYFGLVTEPGFNPWLLLFQACAVAGAVMLARRIWTASSDERSTSGGALVLSEAIVCVLVFAFLVPNKAQAYLPNLTVGFAWLAGAAVAAASDAVARGRLTSFGRGTALLAIVVTYSATAVWHYYEWFDAASARGLAPYEDTSATLRAMVSPGRKHVVAFPTFWLPFRDDPLTTFWSVTAVAPPGFNPPQASFQYRVGLRDLRGEPINVIVDDAHWKPMWQAGGPAAAGWRAFLDTHCSLQATADATPYGNIVAYDCDTDTRPSVTPWIASTDGRWRAAIQPAWAAGPSDIGGWDRYTPGTAVTLESGGAVIAGNAGAGVCTNVPLSPGQPYVLRYAVAGVDAGDLVSIARVSALATHGETTLKETAIWTSLEPGGGVTPQTTFRAHGPDVRVCFYSESPTAFTLSHVQLSRLEPLDRPAAPRTP